MNVPPSTTPKLASKRRWYQFTLRSLLLFVLIVAIGMSAVRVRFSREFEHNSAIMRIETRWGRVSFGRDKAESGWLQKCLGNGFTGQAKCIRGCPRVRSGLEDLIALPEVEQLELTGAHVDAAGLAQLKALPNLWILSLDGTNVTDADLEQLEGLEKLQWLNLSRTQITDKGLEHLKSLHSLTLLFLTNTRVTKRGEDKLRSALPNCSIE